MFRIIIISSFIVFVLFSSVSCSQDNDQITQNEPTLQITEASWAKHYDSIDELCSDPDIGLIAIGEIDRIIDVVASDPVNARWGPVYLYYTDFNFIIERVLEGKDTKEIIIRQTGADGKWEISDDPLFKPGEKYVLFLREYEPGASCVLGGPQGRFKILEGRVYSMNYVLPPKTFFPSAGLDIDGVDLETFIKDVMVQINTIQ